MLNGPITMFRALYKIGKYIISDRMPLTSVNIIIDLTCNKVCFMIKLKWWCGGDG